MSRAERPHRLLWTRLVLVAICVGDTNLLERKGVDRIERESESPREGAKARKPTRGSESACVHARAAKGRNKKVSKRARES